MPLPEDLSKLLESYNAPWLGSLRDALDKEPSVAVRINSRKAPDRTPAGGKPVIWCPQGFNLPKRPAFTFDPELHQGLYYVQEASSMFVAHAVRHILAGSSAPLKVLDACAAPGGKTTAIIDALPEGSLMVANEYVPKRAAILRENLAKWGYPLTVVTQGDTARFRDYKQLFDIIAADVPCSGEGMMRKDDEAVAQWSPALVAQCVARQREILANLWGALKPGGHLIYSTCTFNVDENERMLGYLRSEFGAETVSVPAPQGSGIVSELNGGMAACRFIPGLIDGEGLFMAVVRKPFADEGKAVAPKSKMKKDKRDRRSVQSRSKNSAVPAVVKQWIRPEFKAEISTDGDSVIATFPVEDAPFIPTLEVATVKGKDLIPSQQLALSLALDRNAFAQVAVTREQAVDYLRCETVKLPEGSPKGIVLLTYGDAPLGFVKNLGNRANNLYPKSWRILSARPVPLPPEVLG